MKIAATIQARMGSSRLPGKVLLPMAGKPMLQLQIERLQRCRLLDEVILATTDHPQDDPLADLARRLEIGCFRGSENDVLSRVVGTLRKFGVDLHAEFHGDSPLVDPLIVDSFIGFYLKSADRYDYVTSALKTTYPPGTEVSVYPAPILYDADRQTASDDPLREHVGCHIHQHPERYRLCNLEAPPEYRHPDLYLEVDALDDAGVVSAIFEHFHPNQPGFTLAQVIDFMNSRPDLALKNQEVERRWKVFRQEAR